ncbi:hypothetical protein GSY69_08505 [Brevibacterium sp. 5221]|uniref:Septum formation initiator family protein n=1 Tax=Brevibacterium rongguiense TaxID=2695267 RepID=A0A6N9H7R9_9MICO|nr:septum formation initiator family protein [Brevibacterium rongguiense]MYM20003.1 hypothetical protein [Brevibacterium rongguiense]
MSSRRSTAGSRPAAAQTPRGRRSRTPGRARGAAPVRRLSGRRLVLGCLVIALLAMFMPSINTGIRQAQQIHALEQDNASTRQEVGDLEKKQDSLKDPEYLQRLAREQQGYVNKGEKPYIVVDDRASAQDEPADEQINKSSRPRPWYVEFADSLKSVGLATDAGRTGADGSGTAGEAAGR